MIVALLGIAGAHASCVGLHCHVETGKPLVWRLTGWGELRFTVSPASKAEGEPKAEGELQLEGEVTASARTHRLGASALLPCVPLAPLSPLAPTLAHRQSGDSGVHRHR